MTPLIDRVREELRDTPVYCSIDIDGIDCSKCPGTGKSMNPFIMIITSDKYAGIRQTILGTPKHYACVDAF